MPSVPQTKVFSKEFLDDLEKIWELRHFIPDPTKLYRTEVHLNNAEIKEYLQSHNIDLNPYMMDKTILEAMFFDYLNRVIRFQNGKEQITWEQLLGGRTTA